MSSKEKEFKVDYEEELLKWIELIVDGFLGFKEVF